VHADPPAEAALRVHALVFAPIHPPTIKDAPVYCMKSLLLAAFVCCMSPAIASSDELSRLAMEDQAVRIGEPDPSSDDARRRRVLELLAAGAVSSPRDKFNAALVLQHTGLEFCDGRLRSASPENYLLAHYLFGEALQGGVEDARYLVAASIDRYLGFTSGTQRYGTNRVIDHDSGNELLVPIDRSVSDEERRRYGVPPLSELLERWPEQVAPHAGDDN
jgi:hypothetical protein